LLFFKYESCAIAVKTVRCKLRYVYVSKFTAASRGCPYDTIYLHPELRKDRV